MKESGADISHNWAFTGSTGDFSEENVPIGMKKCKEYGITNLLIELGASDEGCFDWAGKGAAGWVEVFKLHVEWCKKNLGENARVILNVWDFPTAMLKCPQRVLDIVAGLAKFPKEIRISWEEWKTWNVWALTCYTGEVQTCDDLHNVIVRH